MSSCNISIAQPLLSQQVAGDDNQCTGGVGYAQSFLQNPYYFMFASLAKPDDDAELHWLKVHENVFDNHIALVHDPPRPERL
jgi:hypothetical protein